MTTPHSEDLIHLLSRTALGDRQAFAQLYEATSRTLLTVAFRVLSNRDRAEEVLQEAYINVWHSASSYNASLASPMTWLINIVRNKAIDAHRSRATESKRLIALEDADDLESIPSHALGPEEWMEQSLTSIGIRACMGAISSSQRQALALAYYRGLGHAEIASEVGAPVGTVKSWVRRGLESLRKCLEAKKITRT